jgi:hypothetical protein
MTTWILFVFLVNSYGNTAVNGGEYSTFAKCSAAGQTIAQELRGLPAIAVSSTPYRCVKVTK